MTQPIEPFVNVPAALAGLSDIACNLWWSWDREARALFRSISPSLWRTTLHNPFELLHRAPPDRLEALAADEAFLARYRRVRESLDALASGRDTWFANAYPEVDGPIAYFCAEFGLHNSLPIYSGGLGILAGDHCKAAADLGVPLVGVGLMYTQGYFDQRLGEDGWQNDTEEQVVTGLAPVFPVRPDGDPTLAVVRCSGRDVHVGAWRVQVGRVPVYLLDTNLDVNDPADRALSHRLYAGGHDLRLRQEWVLGVGGVRILRRLGYDPGVWHANEGHAGFMLVERVREGMSAGLDYESALAEVRRRSVFTTHTPVPAGHDMFARDLFERTAGSMWEDLGIDAARFFELGRHPDHGPDTFHMTAMAVRLSGAVNGVSRRHASVTRGMLRGLWPDVAEDQVPVASVTNGVHAPTWMAVRLKELFDRTLEDGWEHRVDDTALWDKVLDVDDESLWRVHGELKGVLLDFIHETARRRWRDRWTETPQLVSAGTLLSAAPLTIGFARRFATYKRADLLFRDVDRLRALLTDPARPVQIIFAGKAHPADDPGKKILQRVFEFAHDRSFEGRIAFLEDYEMHMARRLVQGVDLWLNLPIVPLEACGTSGMKAALNGVPQVGTSDGWWAEGHTGDNGWRIPPPAHDDVDGHDAEHLYRFLEEEIVPLYYDRDTRGVPHGWVRCMKHAIREAGTHFTARRMVVDYVREYYSPAFRSALPADRLAG